LDLIRFGGRVNYVDVNYVDSALVRIRNAVRIVWIEVTASLE
jgi:hypothetical protein